MGQLVPQAATSIGVNKLLKGPKAKDVPEPADRPEREIDVEPEDIELGGIDALSEDPTKSKGKRALLRPSGAKATSGLNV